MSDGVEALKRWADEHGEFPSYQPLDPAMATRRWRPDMANAFYTGEWPHASIALARFGPWGQVITAAGFAPRPPGL